MTNSDAADNDRLSAAACAARTGLTVRALRVYERFGLIDPPRTPNGWRRYGQSELTRLNTIAVLKAAGLTLSQIRSILQRKDVPLQILLEAQVESWKVKQDQAERGRILADALLRRIGGGDDVTIDQLCELIRSHEIGSTDPALRPLMLRILGIPAGERHTAIRRHNEALNPSWLEEYQEAVRTQIEPELERLMDEEAPASSPAVQALVARQLRLMTDYRVREEVTASLTRQEPPEGSAGVELFPGFRGKLRSRILAVLKQRPTDSSDMLSHQWTANPFLAPYFSEAESVSTQCRELDALLCQAHGPLNSSSPPGSDMVGRLIGRFALICCAHGLGDPLTYARWAALARPPPPGVAEADDKGTWDALAEAMCRSL